MIFEYPLVFLLIPLFMICARWCKARSEALLFPHLDIFIESSGKSSIWMFILKWLAIIASVVALASPVIEDKMEVENKEGYSIALALDASGSMRYGFGRTLPGIGAQNKFDVSIEMAGEFIRKRKNDQIGLVVFGNFAYVAAPLTYDKNILEQIMGGLSFGIAGSSATVINDALFQSAKLFKNSKAKTKIVILLTDGETRGDHVPFDVAMRLAQKYGVKVYTIGIGNSGEFNEDYLKLISYKTDGQFFSASNKNALQEIYEKIDRLEKSKIKSQKYIKKSYFYEYPLFLAFLSLLLYTFLLNKRGVA